MANNKEIISQALKTATEIIGDYNLESVLAVNVKFNGNGYIHLMDPQELVKFKKEIRVEVNFLHRLAFVEHRGLKILSIAEDYKNGRH